VSVRRRPKPEPEATAPSFDREQVRALIREALRSRCYGEPGRDTPADRELFRLNFMSWMALSAFEGDLAPAPWDPPPAAPTEERVDELTEMFLRGFPSSAAAELRDVKGRRR